MMANAKLLLIFVNEADLWHHRPAYEAVIERLYQLNIAGATAQVGIMGFGGHMRVHHKGVFDIADDRPVTIAAIDDEMKIRAALPELAQIVRGGLIALIDANVVLPDSSDAIAPTMPE
jgi:PII-like signaling protein